MQRKEWFKHGYPGGYLMNMLNKLRLKKKIQDQKSKEKTIPKKSEKRLTTILDFLLDRQASRLGILYSLCTKNHIIAEPKPIVEEPKKVNVSYIC